MKYHDMLAVIIIVSVIIIAIVLILPSNIGSRIATTMVALGVIFTGYGLYLNAKATKREIAKEDIDRTYNYWNNIFTLFIENPSLENIHHEIYGTSIPVKEHAMFSLMAQTVEGLTEAEREGIVSLDPSWKESIEKWVHHPLFPIFWTENREEYTIYTRNYIDNIL